MTDVHVEDQQHTIAHHDDLVLVPKQEYNSLSSIDIRRFDASTGSELTAETLMWTEEQKQTLNENYASGYICLTNDQAGNILITFDCSFGYEPGTMNYPLIFGRLNPGNMTVDDLKTIYLDASDHVYWRNLGVPSVIGDVTTDNYSILYPISLSGTKYGGNPFTAVVKIDCTNNDGDIVKIEGLEADYSNYYGGIMDAIEHVDDKVFFLDSNGRRPYMFICKTDGFNEIAPFPDREETSSSAKGVKTFEIGDIRFVITGNQSEDSPSFNLYSWQDDLPKSELEIDWTTDFYFSHLTKHATLGGAIPTENAIKGTPSLKEITAGAETWHVVSVADNDTYTDTKDLVLYYPGGYMSAYRLGPTERFTGSAQAAIVDDNDFNDIEYYSLSGIKLPSTPEQAGIYIKKVGCSAEKIIIK